MAKFHGKQPNFLQKKTNIINVMYLILVLQVLNTALFLYTYVK
jgi:hypothetical protein